MVTASDPAGLAVAAQLYNSRFDGTLPLAAVYALDERDVQVAVRWSARTGMRIAARSGGHSYGGYSNPQAGVLLDITGIRGTRARPSDRVAAIGAGSELSEVYTALAAAGQTIPAGTCPTVGIAGLALGGGVGFVGRRWGTTSDNVLALRIVTADGRARTIDRRRDEDLYWACRGGGGGNFGVVTAFLMRTFPTDPASTFVLTYDWSHVVERSCRPGRRGRPRRRTTSSRSARSRPARTPPACACPGRSSAPRARSRRPSRRSPRPSRRSR